MNVQYTGGKTNTADALKLAKDEVFQSISGARDHIPDVALVITDGQSNPNKNETVPMANNLKAAGVKVGN